LRRRFDLFYRNLYPDCLRVERFDDNPDHRSVGISSGVFLPSGRVATFSEHVKQHSYGDMLIEVWRDQMRGCPGWIHDPNQRADFIAYVIIDRDCCLVIPLAKLQRVAVDFLQNWIDDDRLYPRMGTWRVNGRQRVSWSVAVKWWRIANAVGMDIERMTHRW
jgi:hypothetical protein